MSIIRVERLHAQGPARARRRCLDGSGCPGECGLFGAARAAELVDPLRSEEPHVPARSSRDLLHMQRRARARWDLYDTRPELV